MEELWIFTSGRFFFLFPLFNLWHYFGISIGRSFYCPWLEASPHNNSGQESPTRVIWKKGIWSIWSLSHQNHLIKKQSRGNKKRTRPRGNPRLWTWFTDHGNLIGILRKYQFVNETWFEFQSLPILNNSSSKLKRFEDCETWKWNNELPL